MSEQHNNFEDLFRQRFGDYQQDPPEALWQKIQTDVSAKTGQNDDSGKKRRGFLFILSTLSLLIIFFGAYVGMKSTIISTPELAQALSPELSERPLGALPPTEPLSTNQASFQNIVKPNTSDAQHYASQIISTPDSKKETAENKILNTVPLNLTNEQQETAEIKWPEEVFNDLPLPIAEEHQLMSESQTQLTQIEEVTEISSADEQMLLQTDSSADANMEVIETSPPHDYGKAAHMFAGLNFTPEMLFGSGSTPNAFAYGAEVSLGYSRGHFSIQSGLGLEFQKMTNVYQAEYRGYESTGNYQYVTFYHVDTIPIIMNDSVIGYHYRPGFHTIQVEIFDSVSHQQTYENQAHYTLMNIPLKVGYHKVIKNWGLGINAGGIATILLKKREAEIPTADEGSDLYSANRLTPVRSQFWFSAVLAPEVEYYFNDDFSWSLEPWIRYSFGYMKEGSSSYGLKPYAIGINTGIKIHF